MLRRPTAVKLLASWTSDSAPRFEREAQLTSQLTHPNTIAIYDYGRTPEGIFYYAMEHQPGLPLDQVIRFDGAQPERRVVHLLRQICSSLAEAHRAGLVHRDVKPANTMLCERGGNYDVVKVLDFGLVKELGSGGEAGVTGTGLVVGTPLYMAPESVAGAEHAGPASDVYAVGAIGYALVTGHQVFTGNSNRPLVAEVCKQLDVALGQAEVRRFSDGEVMVEIAENVRGGDVFVVQSTCTPVNDTLMELLLMLDAFRRASAKRITAVIPYFGYARQDRKVSPRVPISAKLVADLITAAGASRVLTIDLHAGQIQGFFDIPVDNLFAGPVFSKDIKETLTNRNLTVVSPDVGGVVRARAIAKRIDADLAIIDKRREAAGVSEVMNVIGDVKNADCILIDDIVDSAGTLCNAAVALMDQGAKSVSAYVTHGVLSGGAVARVAASPMEKMVITDSIQPTEAVRVSPNVRPLSIASLMAEAMKRIADETSVSSLFD
jgi:ribose-phosphate pyrophosphokinase